MNVTRDGSGLTHESKVARWLQPGWTGVEIGPGQAPIPGIVPPPIYVDCFREFGFERCVADYYGTAVSLPFHSNCLDYVAACHVLEHVANPVAALAEWYRVLRPGGLIYLVVPNRLATWDHTRELTTIDHMLEDYVRQTTEADDTHIDEFCFELDWSRFRPETPESEIPAARATLARGMHEAVARGESINIHFHTFEPAMLRDLISTLSKWPTRRFAWEIVDEEDGFPAACPNGVLMVIRTIKGWLDRAQAEAFNIGANSDRRAAVLLPTARPFADAMPLRTDRS